MELLQLRYFCVVAKHQNMTKAAAELMISQPALSKTIASLEKELGTPLFVRRNRSIFLNRAGEILYQKIDQSINLIDDTVSEIRELSNEPFGNVRLLVRFLLYAGLLHCLPPALSLHQAPAEQLHTL